MGNKWSGGQKSGGSGGGITPPAGDIGGTTTTPIVRSINQTSLGTLSGATVNQVLGWSGTAWVPQTVSSGGGINPPAGDIGGTTGSPVVRNINTTALGTLTGATNGQYLGWNGSAWVPMTLTGGGNMSTSTYDPAGIAQQVVGTTATQTVTNKWYVPRITGVSAPGGTVTMNTDTADGYQVSNIAAAITFANPTGTPVARQILTLELVDNGTSRPIAWGTNFLPSVELPLATIAGVKMNLVFWYDNLVSSKWVLVGSTPGPTVVKADLGVSPGGNFSIPTGTPGTIFPTPPTVTPGTWDVTFEGFLEHGATAGAEVDWALLGGTASYTCLTATAGSVYGGRYFAPTGTAGDNGTMVKFSGKIIVTAAGTLNVEAISTIGSMTFAAQSTTLSSPVQLTRLEATLVG